MNSIEFSTRKSLSALHAATPEATDALAAQFAREMKGGTVITLDGALGAGKTAFCRAALRSLGIQGAIKSPTYALVETYDASKFTVHHIDFYRLETPHAWIDAGLQECFSGDAVVLIEWPSKARGLPDADVAISIALNADESRTFHCVAATPRGAEILAAIN